MYMYQVRSGKSTYEHVNCREFDVPNNLYMDILPRSTCLHFTSHEQRWDIIDCQFNYWQSIAIIKGIGSWQIIAIINWFIFSIKK